MATKRKRTLKKNGSDKPDISLPAWITFWTLVMATMVMIIVTFTTAIQPLLNLPAYGSTAAVTQVE